MTHAMYKALRCTPEQFTCNIETMAEMKLFTNVERVPVLNRVLVFIALHKYL